MKPLIIMAAITLMFFSASINVFASTDGIYGLNKKPTASWDGADSGLIADTSSDYDYVYGDDASLTYELPQTWPSFTFYGQTYNQITVDSNGNIWFGSGGTANAFPLSATGPVISAWNNDLTSYFNGGVFVQHKTDLPLGERVVVEWQAESYTEEGLALPNNFEVILFKNGDIRIDYKSFATAVANDFGSGISSNDTTQTHYLSITSAYFPVYQLSGNSFGFTTSISALQVSFIGTGGGIVSSTPTGIACNTNCSSNFPTGEQITLHSSADQYSSFSGWSNGTCSGLGDCLLTLSADASISAAFARDTTHQVYAPGSTPPYFTTIQGAYDKIASDLGINGSTVKIWATDYTEVVNCNKVVDVILQGGYDSGYTNQVGTTVIHGALYISQGMVTVSGIAIR